MNYPQPHFSEVGAGILSGKFDNAEGTYETIRVHNQRALHINEHLQRLEQSARILQMTMPVTYEQLKLHVERTIEASWLQEAVVYTLLTNTIDGLMLKKGEVVTPLLTILCNPFVPRPSSWYTDGMRVTIRRFEFRHPSAKDLSQYAEKRSLREQSGNDEVLIENHEGHITEGTQTNFFIVKDNQLITPGSEMLLGVTRHAIFDLAKTIMPVVERSLRKEDILAADEVFLTGTLHGVVPVTNVENQIIGEGIVGPWTKKIMELFARG